MQIRKRTVRILLASKLPYCRKTIFYRFILPRLADSFPGSNSIGIEVRVKFTEIVIIQVRSV